MSDNDSFRLISRDDAFKYLIMLIATCLFIFPLRARGEVRLEADYAKCHAEKSHEGTWWQDGYKHELQLTDVCGSAGLSFGTPMKDVTFKLKYVSVGQYSTRAVANADDQDDKSRRGMFTPTPEQCRSTYAADCPYEYDGSGGAQGVLAGIGVEPWKLGPVRLGVVAGLFMYKARWRETIRPVDCPGNVCWEMQSDQRTGWQRAPMYGLTARAWGYLTLSVERYELRMPGRTANPAEPTQAVGITTGFRAPIYKFGVGFSLPLTF